MLFWKYFFGKSVGIREIAEEPNIAYELTKYILVNVLCMKLVHAKLVPKDLNPLKNYVKDRSQKRCWQCSNHKDIFNEDKSHFIRFTKSFG